ncbi:MAG: OmpA family protein [Azoarcus sp.]|jgi:outer membrane protein OmpA-like peptidoglycan-associated protein|nr:OmpA family protein [Azoarcus sp.]
MSITPCRRPAHFRALALLAPLLAAMLLGGCAGVPAPAPTQERDGFSPRRDDGMRATRQMPVDWAGLQREFEAALQGVPDTRIAHLPEGLRVCLPAADGFAGARADVRPPLAALLQRVAPVFQHHPWAAIRIVGHTDGIGSEMSNLNLSFQRADAVMEYLRKQGIALGRMNVDGRGEADPIADNADPAGRARNRRIEIFLNPR